MNLASVVAVNNLLFSLIVVAVVAIVASCHVSRSK